jgi:hypothetical protein
MQSAQETTVPDLATITPATRPSLVSQLLSPRGRQIGTESLVAAAIVTTTALILSPSDPGLQDLRPHLLWIATLVLAARYGVHGLIASLTANVLSLALASVLVGQGVGWIGARAQSASELLAFVGAVAVAWVAGGHERRKASLAAAAAAAAAEASEAQAGFAELRTITDALGQRADRAEVSISFLRDIAARLESDDAEAGASAAMELAIGRLGARAGVVLLHDGARLRSFAHQGTWSVDAASPPDLFQDRTAQRAFELGRVVTGLDVDSVGPLDSDMAAPILRADGTAVGVLAVRGVAFEVLVPAAMRELSAIARWASRSVGGLAPVEADGVTTYSMLFRPSALSRKPAGRNRTPRGTL